MTVKGVLYGKYFIVTRTEKEVIVQTAKRVRSGDLYLFFPRRVDNLFRARRDFVRRVHCAVSELGKPLFITLTFEKEVIDVGYSDSEFRNFVIRLRKVFPKSEYVAVREFQDKNRKGVIHYHVFMWGIPEGYGDEKRGKRTYRVGWERQSRTIAKLWTHGFVDVVKSDGSSRHVSYAAKYLRKAFGDFRLNKRRLFLISHGIPKPWVFVGSQVDLILKHGKLDLLKTHESYSMFVGRVNYEMYGRNV